MPSARKPQIWFLTGSQHLYGPETLAQVADQSQQIQRALARLRPDRRRGRLEAGADRRRRRSARSCRRRTPTRTCLGVIAWMHTFSPAKMWITGLDALRKPLLHLHTQLNAALPWAIDRHGLHEPQPGRARRPRVRLHPDPARASPARRSPATRPTRSWSAADRRLDPRRRGSQPPRRPAPGPVRRQHARRRRDRGRQGRGGAAVRRLGQHLRGQRPGRGGRRGARRRDRRAGGRVRRLLPAGPRARPGAVRGTTSLRYAARIEAGPARRSWSAAGSARSPRTSRTSAGCGSCRAWPCSG